jgi:hypothetical protein
MLIHAHHQPKVVLLCASDEVTQIQFPNAFIFGHYGHVTDKAVIVFKTLRSVLRAKRQNRLLASIRQAFIQSSIWQTFLKKAHVLLHFEKYMGLF